MSKPALILLGLFSFTQGGIKVEKVLETTSIQEYNRWLKTNKESPKINPVHIRVTRSQTATPILHEYRIEYYNEEGRKVKEENIVDSMAYVYVSPSCDRVVISKGNRPMYSSEFHNTVKDERGITLFTLLGSSPLIPTDIGIYIEDINSEDIVTSDAVVRTFNEKGKEINHLKGIGKFNLLNLVAPEDRRYTVLQGGITGGTAIIALDRQGKELWRKEIKKGSRLETFISKNGSMVGVNVGEAVYLYSENGSVVQTYTPLFSNDMIGDVNSAFSSDGSKLLTGLGPEIKFYDNKIGQLIWKTNLIEKGESTNVKYVHITGDGEKLVVIYRSHNVYIFDRDGNLITNFNLNLGKQLISKTIRKDGKIIGKRKEEILNQNWYSEVIGDYLIITKGTIAKFLLGIEGREKIIYQINRQ